MKFLTDLFKKKSDKASLILNPNGINYIGGKPDPEFKMPKLETSPMVYLGFISEKEPYLDLIDFDFHLICPIFLDLQTPIFFDYSEPKQPKLIRDNVPTNFSQLFDEIPNNAYIEYKKLSFCFDNPSPTRIKIGVHDIDMIPGEFGFAGVPHWIHDEEYPFCPITGNKMKFLFQLGDIDDCENIIAQDILDKEYIDSYLHFGHGYLYVFYEPDSKVVAYINQL